MLYIPTKEVRQVVKLELVDRTVHKIITKMNEIIIGEPVDNKEELTIQDGDYIVCQTVGHILHQQFEMNRLIAYN